MNDKAITDKTHSTIEDAYTNAVGRWVGRDWESPTAITLISAKGRLARTNAAVAMPRKYLGPSDDNHLTRDVERANAACIACDLARIADEQEFERAESDAIEAEAHGLAALVFARNKNWNLALEAAYKAITFEKNWGDTPTWGPLLKAIEAVVAETEETTS